MSKSIYLKQNDDELIAQLKSALANARCYDQISLKSLFTTDKRDVVLSFSERAWIKIKSLVDEFDTEVQWHGLVRRVSESEFNIYDIIVPPHSVTGSTVTSDYKAYQDWLFNLDDETFNALKFHGHSHVNMGCSPSSIDTKYRHDVVTQLPSPEMCVDGTDSFYIFLIFNKKGEWTGEVYDVTNNALYETKEISLCVPLGDDETIDSFIEAAKKVAVKEPPKTATQVVVGYGTGANGSGYGGFNYNNPQSGISRREDYYGSSYYDGREWD